MRSKLVGVAHSGWLLVLADHLTELVLLLLLFRDMDGDEHELDEEEFDELSALTLFWMLMGNSTTLG